MFHSGWGCGAQPGHRLWNADNWDYTPRDLRLETMLEFLPSYLKHNVYERPLLAHYLGVTDPLGPSLRYAAPRSTKSRLATDPSMTVARILEALCDLPGIVNNVEHTTYLEQCDFFGITNAELLCGPCLRNFVQARFWLFWQSVKVGAAPWEATRQNCWLGYDCASQAVDPEHAYAKNVR
ncbi:hypothetical protein EXIGLDRAFT_55900 [Exidia glandulosa HHB12029]|uniref:Uncharacterized protein n=1 Tax=Exidia glandulosa HHB12029 TaxID=1314781 RepID=A0A165I975_EXIGL|nr:hypothetical protein EXIGLDRAFT_55900 [Exidia glandulosa HHB12029]